MEGKKTKGRQKIEMKKIENEDDRLITFSKRRSGIYKKASELVTLCGAEVGVVIFSPAGKPFSFGHPSVESVANRFLRQNPPPGQGDNTHPLVEAHRRVRINELNQQYNELLSLLEAEKEQGKALQKLTKARGNKGWWEVPTEELGYQELKQMNAQLEELHKNLCNHMKEKAFAGGALPSSSNYFPGNSSQGSMPFNPNVSEADPPLPPGYGYGPGNF